MIQIHYAMHTQIHELMNTLGKATITVRSQTILEIFRIAPLNNLDEVY